MPPEPDTARRHHHQRQNESEENRPSSSEHSDVLLSGTNAMNHNYNNSSIVPSPTVVVTQQQQQQQNLLPSDEDDDRCSNHPSMNNTHTTTLLTVVEPPSTILTSAADSAEIDSDRSTRVSTANRAFVPYYEHDHDEHAWQSEHVTSTESSSNHNHHHHDVWSTSYDEEECKREISEEDIYAFMSTERRQQQQNNEDDNTADHRVAVMAQQEEYDAQLAASVAEEEDRLLAMKLAAAYEGRDLERAPSVTAIQADPLQDMSSSNLPITTTQAEGTVVEIQDMVERVISTEYVPQNDEETIHAQWIGHEYSNSILSSSQVNTDIPQTTVAEDTPAIAAVVEPDDGAQEATVIDSAPLEKEQHTFTEEAQVLPEQQDAPSLLDRKPSSMRSSPSRRSRRRRQRHIEAEITSVRETEDIHPLERTDDGAQAELVGTVDSYTVAVPPISQTTAPAAESVEITSAEGEATSTVPTPEAEAVFATARNETGEGEVAAIASAIMDDRLQAQSEHPTEEAEVLLENEMESELDQKPAAVNRRNYYAIMNGYQSYHSSASVSTQAEVRERRNGEDTLSSGGDGDHAGNGEALSTSREPLTASCVGQAQQVLQAIDTTHETLHITTSLERSSESMAQPLPNVVMPSAEIFEEQPSTVLDLLPSERGNIESSLNSQCVLADVAQEAADPSAIAHIITVNAMRTQPLLGYNTNQELNEQRADIVDIQHLDDIHPLEQIETLSNSSTAELVGTASLHDTPPVESSSQFPTLAEAMAEEMSEATLTTGVATCLEEATLFAYDAESQSLNGCFADALKDQDKIMKGDLVDSDLGGLSDRPSAMPDALQPPATAAESSLDEEHAADWLHVQIPDQGPHGRCEATNSDVPAPITKKPLSRTASANFHMLSSSIARGSCVAIEALFGSPSPSFVNRHHLSENVTIQAILPRELLPWSVIYNSSTNMWITTIQTNQRALDSNNIVEASKSLRAFSMPTEKQAMSLARAWTPPRMAHFESNKKCHICQSKFAILRRPCHCRNCGVCICKDCTVQWPSIMIPETYNIKKEHHVNVCKSCNWLCNSFRRALLEGNQDEAVALAATGNVNMHTPFANVKGELFYPVHCAVLGRNLALLKFLVDENCCPVRSVRISGSTRDSSTKYTPIVTSRGRSLLGIAMETQNIQIIRYLIAEKNLSLVGEKDISHESLCRNLEMALRILPQDCSSKIEESMDNSYTPPIMGGSLTDVVPLSPSQLAFDSSHERSLSEKARDFGALKAFHATARHNDENGSDADQSVNEECIICFDRVIDCVATPCGHQMCCLQCSENLSSRCPVCSASCSFMRIFKS